MKRQEGHRVVVVGRLAAKLDPQRVEDALIDELTTTGAARNLGVSPRVLRRFLLSEEWEAFRERKT